MSKIRLLEVSGTPFEMGQQHGQAYAGAIAELAEDRVQLSSNKNWTGNVKPKVFLPSISRYLDE